MQQTLGPNLLMLDTPQITQTAAQLTAIIRLTIPREEIRKVMGPGIREMLDRQEENSRVRSCRASRR